MRLRPFFSYFGSKWLLARHYPAPLHATIVEPFAGSAGYALRHHERDVLLIDLNPVIAGLWTYLTKVSAAEVRALPINVESVDDIRGPQEARWLIGFWLGRAQHSPSRNMTSWGKSGRWPRCFWGESIRERVARQVEHIRHWRVKEASYDAAPQIAATWFVDPPYVRQGGAYFGASAIDHAAVGNWARGLPGQVIVCEAAGASWLPFEAFRVARANSSRGKGRVSHEVVWTREAA